MSWEPTDEMVEREAERLWYASASNKPKWNGEDSGISPRYRNIARHVLKERHEFAVRASAVAACLNETETGGRVKDLAERIVARLEAKDDRL